MSGLPSGPYRWFGRVTKQTGLKPRLQPLFHGDLALSPSLDYSHSTSRAPGQNQIIYTGPSARMTAVRAGE